MELRLWISGIVSAVLIPIVPADAALTEAQPKVACAYLSENGLGTRGRKHHYDAEYGCSSPYMEFGSGYPLKNNLAYYVQRDRSSARQLKLALKVNNKSEARAAHSEMLKVAKVLSWEALGDELPSTVADAITNGTGQFA